VALARDGHAPAFEVIVRRYRKELLAYCGRMQPRWGSPEDAVQQTLLQAWRALTSGSEVREVRPWLYRIAHNVVVSDLRSPSAAPQELEAPALGPEVDQLVEQRIRARAALDAMASLPTLQRQALVSTTFDGASRAEVAAALGLSRGAVRGLVYRARETLRAAAAAITPSPALSWALRRAEAASGSSRATVEALAGGGGAGVAGLLVKGSAVITLAGVVAGTGSVLLPAHPQHHGQARAVAAHHAVALDLPAGDRAQGPESARGAGPAGRSASTDETRDGRGTRGHEHGGSRSASTSGGPRDQQGLSGGQDGGRSGGQGGSSGGSDGGSPSGATFATPSGSSDGSRATSGGEGSSGGPSGPGGSTTTSDSRGGGGSRSATDGSGSTSTTTDGGQAMAPVTTTSGGGFGSDGGTSGRSGDLGSGETATTSGGH
jgi:RNA polymerase sigma factor (sigma-70 family)